MDPETLKVLDYHFSTITPPPVPRKEDIEDFNNYPNTYVRGDATNLVRVPPTDPQSKPPSYYDTEIVDEITEEELPTMPGQFQWTLGNYVSSRILGQRHDVLRPENSPPQSPPIVRTRRHATLRRHYAALLLGNLPHQAPPPRNDRRDRLTPAQALQMLDQKPAVGFQARITPLELWEALERWINRYGHFALSMVSFGIRILNRRTMQKPDTWRQMSPGMLKVYTRIYNFLETIQVEDHRRQIVEMNLRDEPGFGISRNLRW